MAMHFDPNGSIARVSGKKAGPLAEVKVIPVSPLCCVDVTLLQYWEDRLRQLVLVRDQLGSVEVLQVLHGLQQAHSTYADAFIDVHKDVNKVHVWMYSTYCIILPHHCTIVIHCTLCMYYKSMLSSTVCQYCTTIILSIVPPMYHHCTSTAGYSGHGAGADVS